LKALRIRWVAEHREEVCPHPSWEKEYFGGADTGDKNCVRCGAEKSLTGDITESKTFVEAIYRRS
jgi:hypothetical protein